MSASARRVAQLLAGVGLVAVFGVAGRGIATADPSAPPTGGPNPPSPPAALGPPAPPPLPALPLPPWAAPPGPALMLAPAKPVWLDIPKLRVRSDKIVPLGRRPDGSMQVPGDAHTAGWYTGAPTPGALGPAVLAAHVDWKGDLGLFHDLGALVPGDVVRVGRDDGSVAVFAVDHVESYPKDAFPTRLVYGAVGDAALRLITCGGDFEARRASYRDNVVAFAELVNVES